MQIHRGVLKVQFKDRIKHLRESQDKTLEDVAKIVGVSRQTIQKYESGTIQNVPFERVELLAKALSVSPGYLMDWEREPDDLDRAVLNQFPDFKPGKGNLPNVGTSPNDSAEDSLWTLREALRRDPKRRMLFDAAANVSEKDIQTAVRLLDALKGNNEDGTD